MSTLYVVATPIGNLRDITLRALDILREVDIIACEDTRHTRKLLSAYDIHKRLLSCRAGNEQNSAEGICSLLAEGKNIAYASDAGTPGLSDPGDVLVRIVRSNGYEVIPVPGASAFATLASVGAFPGRSLLFDGFPSPKPGKRRKRLRELMEREENFLIYESPFRILKLLSDIEGIDPDRELLIGREMTKIHEEYLEGKVKEILEILSERKDIKGEFSVLVSGRKKG